MPGSRTGLPRVFARLAPAAGLALLLLCGCGGSSEPAGDREPAKGREPAADKPLGQRPKAVVPYWVNPQGNAAQQLARYRAAGRAGAAELIERIARQPVAEWIGVDDPRGQAHAFTTAAIKADRDALLVLYNIPHRDCGQYSKGGAADGDAYRAWLDQVAAGIGNRPATVILEPDALPHVEDGCTPHRYHEERYALLAEAISKLAELPYTKVYLDAGNPRWITKVSRMAKALQRAGIEQADGFALNTSNYQTTRDNMVYGRKLSALVGGKHFVIDTGRNGRGPAPGADDPQAWCNPQGRALGEPPTTETDDELVDAYLWVKRPGESDGPCKGGPQAGEWWPEYALELARNAQPARRTGPAVG
ncbi:glycoside hydrolase family 6 protein [Streptomyces zagrosensis]|uniref:Glucanase n=1 Tax=Streptomyces zagrosensis TaxID=1042984 RepID=A0A7W9Q7R1_9ACTN|nr:glycoside hydrolase family 6 protein [Streptomyces zagrosensis]MBB5935156.1 endoglucanase [Streptomyces zagrosensis]